MVPSRYRLVLCLLFLSPLVRGQDKAYKTYYMLAEYQIGSKKNYNFTRQISNTSIETHFYKIMDFNKNGMLKAQGYSFGNSPKINRYGTWISYRENGTKISEVTYTANKKEGLAKWYYPNGQVQKTYTVLPSDKVGFPDSINYIACWDSVGNAIMTKGNGRYFKYDDNFTTVIEEGAVKHGVPDSIWTGTLPGGFRFTELWEMGRLVSGTTIDSVGNEHVYTQFTIPPEYPDGMKAFMESVSRNFTIPRRYIQPNISLEMSIQFRIGRDGQGEVEGIKEDVPTDLERAARNVMKKTKPWRPAYVRGTPTEFTYTVPINIHTYTTTTFNR